MKHYMNRWNICLEYILNRYLLFYGFLSIHDNNVVAQSKLCFSSTYHRLHDIIRYTTHTLQKKRQEEKEVRTVRRQQAKGQDSNIRLTFTKLYTSVIFNEGNKKIIKNKPPNIAVIFKSSKSSSKCLPQSCTLHIIALHGDRNRKVPYSYTYA